VKFILYTRTYLIFTLDDIILVLQQNRLYWHGHVLQNEDNDRVKKCTEYGVEGARQRGTQKRTWREVVQKNCHAGKLYTGLPLTY